MGQPPDAAVAEHGIELILLDFLPQISAFLRPGSAFNHAAIHVGDIQRAVWRVGDPDRAEQRIERADELRARIHVPELRQPLARDRPQAPDRPRDGFAMKIVPDEIPGESVASIDSVAGGGRRVDHRPVG